MKLKIPVAHDFICPWCWIGLFQAKRLVAEENVEIEWLGYELFPLELEWPTPGPAAEVPANKPVTPTRLEFLLAVENMTMPGVTRPHHMRTDNAHQALEFAKDQGVGFEFCETLYREYWENGTNINNIETLVDLAKEYKFDESDFRRAIEDKRFAERIVGFDDDAYAKGVYNVPTFFIGEKRLAEQPYSALKKATIEAKQSARGSAYAPLTFPPASPVKPYTYIAMVSTIDGKTISGTREESVVDLGSKLDHTTLRAIEATADAVLIGAGTLRATSSEWTPKTKYKIAITKSGNLDYNHSFLQGENVLVASPSGTTPEDSLTEGITLTDAFSFLRELRKRGIERLLVLGGSETNAFFLEDDLVDELFLTIAPKVKLGKDSPTYAGGQALSKNELLKFKLIDHHAIENELFLRYRRSYETSNK